MTEWDVVIPVKGTADAKSRFGVGEHAELATAIALDTVAAALRAGGVSRVFVVTVAGASAPFEALGTQVVVETGRGLNGAIADGLAAAGGSDSHVAVLLGDLPALQPSELTDALAAAAAHNRAMAADREGTGTVMITALVGVGHDPAFGPHSNARHRARGYVELDLPADSGLRSDVDTLDRLTALHDRLAPRTTAAVLTQWR